MTIFPFAPRWTEEGLDGLRAIKQSRPRSAVGYLGNCLTNSDRDRVTDGRLDPSAPTVRAEQLFFLLASLPSSIKAELPTFLEGRRPEDGAAVSTAGDNSPPGISALGGNGARR